ncbi:branched-chain alpha-keto acid dehydrogenase subunit E2 [Streptomyces gancidicus BKS 13-15]|uniref:Dihydrolipoamide acetyltransferase component of pyruvate dehydrogenase complex n=2 Tax=Streptomyces TaxID=1883 RepID=M3DZ67_STREZ|nr:branched-chain alpha-keto acid dehydrogenase subunit E2 [Streptomyces gancidicus BKS 13-15]
MTTMTNASVREFKMPDVGEGLTEAEILKWYVQPGDTVTDGQVVCEVETAKAAVELPIPYDGVVRALHFPEGTTVDVGTSIIAVEVAGGAAPAQEEAPAAPAPAAEPEQSAEQPAARQPVLVGYGVATSSTRRRPRKQAQDPAAQQAASAVQSELNGHGAAPAAPPAPAAPVAPAAPASSAAPAQRPLAKPPVRKLAKDLGVDLATITPTGPDGVITRDDVHAAVAAAQAPQQAAPAAQPAAPAAPAPSAAPASYDSVRETRIPVKGVRKATAAAMVGSAFTAPHVTEFVTVDVTRTMKLVEELKQDKEFAGLRVNPLLLIAKALLVAIRRNPDINASWDEAAQEIVVKHYVNLGIAAATPRGLIVPNIKDAHAKTLPELAASLGELVSTAREGRTSPSAMQGGTVTITNVGVFGVDTGTPILNPGESAILAVGAIKLQPWVHKGKVKPRQVTTLALSFDHRLVDGELGSKVLADVAAVLEQPKRLITWA